MFGALNVQPKGARIYRSQVTEEEFRLATDRPTTSTCTGADGEDAGADCNPGGQPIIDYEALYPQDCDGDVDDPDPTDGKDGVWCREGKDGLPIINMQCNAAAVAAGANCVAGELLHSDINAIIAGPNDDGTFPAHTYPLESVGRVNPQVPNRLDAFREFTSQYHDEQTNSQVYPNWYNHPVMGYTLHGVGDAFMINYGSGGIGSEIISNRLRTGPMHDCTDCAYEEFFLASQTVGDPALLVNYPANTLIEACSPENIAAGPTDPNACWRNDTMSNPVERADPRQLRAVPGRSVERAPRVHGRPHEDAQHACRCVRAAHLPLPQPPVAVQPERRQRELPGRPGDHAGLRPYVRARERWRGPQPHRWRRDLPLPFLPAFRTGHVVPHA
jgi:hypothetical protein